MARYYNKDVTGIELEVFENDPDIIDEYADRTHGIYGTTVVVLTREYLAALFSGKILAHGDGEYLVIVKLEESPDNG